MRERVDLDRLRALHARLAAYLTRADVLEMVSAVPALLDAAEESQTLLRERDAALAECRTRGIELDHARTAGPPGLWRCPRCNFVCVRSNLNALDGSITANYEEPDPCPNDGEHLNRVTWREHADDMEARCAEQMERAAQAEKERDDARAKLDAVMQENARLREAIEALAESYEGRAEEKLDYVLDAIEPEVVAEELRAALTPTKESDRDN